MCNINSCYDWLQVLYKSTQLKQNHFFILSNHLYTPHGTISCIYHKQPSPLQYQVYNKH